MQAIRQDNILEGMMIALACMGMKILAGLVAIALGLRLLDTDRNASQVHVLAGVLLLIAGCVVAGTSFRTLTYTNVVREALYPNDTADTGG